MKNTIWPKTRPKVNKWTILNADKDNTLNIRTYLMKFLQMRNFHPKTLLSTFRHRSFLVRQSVPSTDKLTDKLLIITAADEILIFIYLFIFVLFFREYKAWYFMWIVYLSDDSHRLLSLIFSEIYSLQIQYVVHYNFALRWLWVCIEAFQPNQPYGVMSSVISLPNYTFTGQS